MRALLIDDVVKSNLRRLVEHAEKNVFTIDDLLNIKNGAEPPPGDREGFSCNIPIGFRVVFSIERQPIGMVRHLSVSVDSEKSLPHPHAVIEIMRELGFENLLEDCVLDFKSDLSAVNILEVIK